MTKLSDYLEDNLITHLFRTSSFTKPTVLAFCALTTAADDDDTGQFSVSTGVEVTNAGAYARVDRPPLDANWNAPSGGSTANTAAITYTKATGNWGTVAAMAITDSTTYDAGNMLFHGTVGTSKAINTDDTMQYDAGDVTVSFD